MQAQMNYSPIIENVYRSDHDEVVEWNREFQMITKKRHIFDAIEKLLEIKNLNTARVVGVSWHRFSAYMPWFLCQASAYMKDNMKRHYAIQTAFEELGMRDVNTIHCDWFWQACEIAGLKPVDQSTILQTGEIDDALHMLTGFLHNANSDLEVMGIMLGLEIPAEENIETVFNHLSHNRIVGNHLEIHDFFRMHRMIEIEHVRLNVSNFLRFCPTLEQKSQYLKGFDLGLRFWSRFWREVSQMAFNQKLIGETSDQPSI